MKNIKQSSNSSKKLKQKIFLNCLRHEGNFRLAADAANVSRQTAYNWEKACPIFALDVSKAKQEADVQKSNETLESICLLARAGDSFSTRYVRSQFGENMLKRVIKGYNLNINDTPR